MATDDLKKKILLVFSKTQRQRKSGGVKDSMAFQKETYSYLRAGLSHVLISREPADVLNH